MTTEKVVKPETPQRWARAGAPHHFPDYAAARLAAGTLFQELNGGKALKMLPDELRNDGTRVRVKLRTKNGRELGFDVIGYRLKDQKQPNQKEARK